jgi:uncharacterized protein (DUF608 family)
MPDSQKGAARRTFDQTQKIDGRETYCLGFGILQLVSMLLLCSVSFLQQTTVTIGVSSTLEEQFGKAILFLRWPSGKQFRDAF